MMLPEPHSSRSADSQSQSIRRAVRASSVACVASLVLGACKQEAPPPPPPPPVPVVVASVARQDVPIYLESVAQTVASDAVEIRARVVGLLETRNFEEGKLVKKGDVLFSIDPREYQAKLAAAKAMRDKAEADLKLAKEQVSVRAAEASVAQSEARVRKTAQDVARLEPLAAADAVPKQDLDAAVAARDVANADLDAAEATLINSKLREEVGILVGQAALDSATAAVAQAELDLGWCTVTAPMDGMIGRANVSVGDLVGRGEPTLLVTLSTVDPMHVIFTIAEQEYLRLKAKYGVAGAQAQPPPLQLTLADGSVFAHPGKLVVVEREVDPRTGTLVLEAEFPNPDGLLRPGQFGRVRVLADEIRGALVIDRRAVMEQQSAKVVYVVEADSKVALRTVTLGERFGDHVVVREGLADGERVIVEGQAKARPGSPVAITEPSTKPAKPAGSAAPGGEAKPNGQGK